MSVLFLKRLLQLNWRQKPLNKAYRCFSNNEEHLYLRRNIISESTTRGSNRSSSSIKEQGAKKRGRKQSSL